MLALCNYCLYWRKSQRFIIFHNSRWIEALPWVILLAFLFRLTLIWLEFSILTKKYYIFWVNVEENPTLDSVVGPSGHLEQEGQFKTLFKDWVSFVTINITVGLSDIFNKDFPFFYLYSVHQRATLIFSRSILSTDHSNHTVDKIKKYL